MPGRPALSVVLPTYNEAGSIGAVLDETAAALDAGSIAWEAVVVDDDSPDGTQAEVEAAAQRRAGRVRLVVRRGERGLASAVVRGFREATGELVAVMDADGQHPPDALVAIVRGAIGAGADVVVGTRHAAGGSVGSFGALRRLVSWGAALAARLALPPVRHARLSDPMSGLFLVRRAAVADVALNPRGFKILLEVLARATPTVGHRLRVAELPYTFGVRRAGASKLGAGVAFACLGHLLALAMRDRENRRLAEFAAVGATGVAVNLGILYAGGRWYGATAGAALLLSGAVAREVSVAWNFAWNDLITYRDRRQATGHGILVRFLRSNLVSLVSFAAYLGLLWLFETLGVHYLAAGALAILLSFFLNFRGATDWAYRPARRRSANGAP